MNCQFVQVYLFSHKKNLPKYEPNKNLKKKKIRVIGN